MKSKQSRSYLLLLKGEVAKNTTVKWTICTSLLWFQQKKVIACITGVIYLFIFFLFFFFFQASGGKHEASEGRESRTTGEARKNPSRAARASRSTRTCLRSPEKQKKMNEACVKFTGLSFWFLLQVTQRPATAGALFKSSMIALVEKLVAKVITLQHNTKRRVVFKLTDIVLPFLPQKPFYVRCIKPNDIKSAAVFDEKRVSHQVSGKWN